MKKVRKRKSHVGLTVTIILLVLVLAAGAGGWFWFQSELEPVSDQTESIAIKVTEGESAAEVLTSLDEAGLLKNRTAAEWYSKIHDGFSYYVGTYELAKNMSVPEILDYLSDPANLAASYAVVTIPEGSWAKDIAKRISEALPDLTADQLLDLWNSNEFIQQASTRYSFLNPEEVCNDQYFVKLEGYLYPETYYMDFDMSAEQVTYMMLDQFQAYYDAHKAQFDASSMSVQQIVTFASVVQFESGDASIMPDIAGVFKNRLEQGMPLQSSVTVCYALYDQFEKPEDCETNADIDSPYNTYMHDGLPIGPILNPGAAALDAALSPADNDYLYFVSDIYGDGATHFARTYEEHLENVEKYNLNY